MGSEPGDKRELELRPVGLEPMAREVEEAMDGEARLERELFERPDGRRVFYERVFLAGEGWVSESIKGADSPTVLAEFLERRRAQLAERARGTSASTKTGAPSTWASPLTRSCQRIFARSLAQIGRAARSGFACSPWLFLLADQPRVIQPFLRTVSTASGWIQKSANTANQP